MHLWIENRLQGTMSLLLPAASKNAYQKKPHLKLPEYRRHCSLLHIFSFRLLLEPSCSAESLVRDMAQQPSTSCSQFSTAISIGIIYIILEWPGSSGKSLCLQFTQKDTAVASLLLAWSDLEHGWDGWVQGKWESLPPRHWVCTGLPLKSWNPPPDSTYKSQWPCQRLKEMLSKKATDSPEVAQNLWMEV